ncbi:MAG: hypothetical protein R3300_21800 [Candidatus Promineifilaceae bacterium]|nr:hypothetical protein [Candidatus Promineifilaceae bacterium]
MFAGGAAVIAAGTTCTLSAEAALACLGNPSCAASLVKIWTAADVIDDTAVQISALMGDPNAQAEVVAMAQTGMLQTPFEGPWNFANSLLRRSDIPDAPGSMRHMFERWQQYLDRGGTWEFSRWRNVYEANQTRARVANRAVDEFHETLGWGRREITIRMGDDVRRLDIADPARMEGIEYKTGYQYLSSSNRSQLERDAQLVAQGWNITWIFEGKASQPLLNELEGSGILWSTRR